MPLALIPPRAAAPDQFSVFEGGRKVGRICKMKNEWIWDVDWFGAGRKLVSERRAAGAHEASDVLFSRYWKWVAQSGVEKFGKGHAPTRDKALAEFEAAWGYVTEAGTSQRKENIAEPRR
jgi:hypothetical protein